MRFARKVGIGLLASSIAAPSIYVYSSQERLDNFTLLLKGYDRAIRATVTGALIIADYKWTLRGLEDSDPDYWARLPEVHQRAAERMLALARTNKGVYIKAGQYLATLKPAIPKEFADTLAVLTDMAPARPFDTIVQTIYEEFGKPIYQLFSEFDAVPVGSASLAQVHRAKTIDGKSVAVKVQHRNLVEICSSDMLTIESLTKVVEWFFPKFDFQWIVPEFKGHLFQELDFKKEGENCELCGRNFAKDPRIRVPKIYKELTSSRVLTMEFMEGVKIKDIEGIKKKGLDPLEVAETVSYLFGEQIYSHGFVHCDPHPGNILVRPVPASERSWSQWAKTIFMPWRPPPAQVILLDHGLYRRLREDFRLNYAGMWRALLLQDVDALHKHCKAMGVERYVELFPLIFTFRSMKSKVKLGERMPKAEREELRKRFESKNIQFSRGLQEVLTFMEAIPRDFLFVMRTNNLVRSLNFELGGTSRQRFKVNADCCTRGLYYTRPYDIWNDEELSDLYFRYNTLIPPPTQSATKLFMSWADVINLRVRIFAADTLLSWYAEKEGSPDPSSQSPPDPASPESSQPAVRRRHPDLGSVG